MRRICGTDQFTRYIFVPIPIISTRIVLGRDFLAPAAMRKIPRLIASGLEMEIALRLASVGIAVAINKGPVGLLIADQVVGMAIFEEAGTVQRKTALVLHDVFRETRFRTACRLDGAPHSIDCPPRAIGFDLTVSLCSSATSRERKGE